MRCLTTTQRSSGGEHTISMANVSGALSNDSTRSEKEKPRHADQDPWTAVHPSREAGRGLRDLPALGAIQANGRVTPFVVPVSSEDSKPIVPPGFWR